MFHWWIQYFYMWEKIDCISVCNKVQDKACNKLIECFFWVNTLKWCRKQSAKRISRCNASPQCHMVLFAKLKLERKKKRWRQQHFGMETITLWENFIFQRCTKHDNIYCIWTAEHNGTLQRLQKCAMYKHIKKDDWNETGKYRKRPNNIVVI